MYKRRAIKYLTLFCHVISMHFLLANLIIIGAVSTNRNVAIHETLLHRAVCHQKRTTSQGKTAGKVEAAVATYLE